MLQEVLYNRAQQIKEHSLYLDNGKYVLKDYAYPGLVPVYFNIDVLLKYYTVTQCIVHMLPDLKGNTTGLRTLLKNRRKELELHSLYRDDEGKYFLTVESTETLVYPNIDFMIHRYGYEHKAIEKLIKELELA